MAKPGPKSKKGKAAVRLNAVRHGVLSTTPVIPGLENQEDWEAHRAGLMASRAPEGPLEEALAERVALLFWRLQRVIRYERDVIAVAQERLVGDLPLRPRRFATNEEADFKLALTRERLRLLRELAQLPDDAEVAGDDAAIILSAVARYADDVDLESFSIPGVPDDIALEDFTGWTARLIRDGIAAIAADAGQDPKILLVIATSTAELEVINGQIEAERKARDLDRERRERLLPDGPTLDNIVRYEAHLGRQLYQALHELEALQARRRGGAPPLQG